LGTKSSVLAAIDLSTSSLAVARRAERIARQTGRRLVLAHVAPDDGLASADTLIPPGWGTRLRTSSSSSTRSVLGAAARRSSNMLERWIRRSGVEPDATRTLVGPKHTALLAAARAAKAQLIVTGVHRSGGKPKTLLLGTTTDRLLRKSEVPVLLARTNSKRPYGSVLVALDLGRTNQELVHAASALAPDARLHLVHVIPDGLAKKSERDRRRRAARAALEALASTARASGDQLRLSVLDGDPRERLLQAADRDAADLIVVGTRARKGLERLLLGSTAEHVLRSASADVLAIPPEV